MYAQYINIYANIGTDYSESFVIKNQNNVPYDLTGYRIVGTISNSVLPSDTINSTLTNAYNFTVKIDDALTGKITISMKNDVLPSYGRYFLNINAVKTSTNITSRVLYGIFTVAQ